MSRVQPRLDHVAAEDLRAAAVERFFNDGYRGSSVAAIAADAGLRTAAFYSHFSSKRTLLRDIARGTYRSGVAETELAVRAAGADPRAQLDAAIWAQCDFAIRCQRAIRVVETECAHLECEDLEIVEAAKCRFTRIVDEIVDNGMLVGVFSVSGPSVTAHALTSMCSSIGVWYSPQSSQSPRQIAETYCEFALRIAGVDVGLTEERHLALVRNWTGFKRSGNVVELAHHLHGS